MKNKKVKSKIVIVLIILVAMIVTLLILAVRQSNLPEMPKNWNSNKVTAVKSTDTIPVTVPVPKGFIASGLATESTVAGGFVIYEGTNKVDWTDSTAVKTAQETRNQFVWVPVTDPSSMFGTDIEGNSLGKLYHFSQTSASPYNWTETDGIMSWTIRNESDGSCEPDASDILYGCDASEPSFFKNAISETMTCREFKIQLQEEFEAMKTSIETYGGFYIGRYETGDLVATKDMPAKVVKNNSNIDNVNWFYIYQNSKNIVQNKTAKAAGIETSMVWGCQWDSILRWFQTSSANDVANFVMDSSGKGNYARETNGESLYKKLPTGSNDDYCVNNIYDLAGNMCELTLEHSYPWFQMGRRRRM